MGTINIPEDYKSELNNISLSMPAIIGKNGVETIVPIQLNEYEIAELKKSAETLKKILEENF